MTITQTASGAITVTGDDIGITTTTTTTEPQE